MDLGLKEKVAIITGASSGIGRTIALAFAAEGAHVVATYFSNPAGAEETVNRVKLAGGDAIAARLELRSAESARAVAAEAVQRWGGVDVLVNNAVVMPDFPAPGELFETSPPQRFADSLTDNLLGPYLMSQAVVGHMRSNGWGRIVHVSSNFAMDGFPGRAPYAAAKSGLHGLTRVMSRELARAGILTNVVVPAFIAGDKPQSPALLQHVAAAASTKQVTTPEEVAGLIVFLASNANTNITGELVRVDGHFLTPAP